MTVELVAQSGDGALTRHPIATSEFFANYWARGARELRLTITPTLGAGTVLDEHGAASLADELVRLRAWSEGQQGDKFEHLAMRAGSSERALDLLAAGCTAMRESGIPALYLPATGRSRSGFKIIERR